MQETKEFLDFGFETMLQPGNVIVIEWAEKVSELVRTLNRKKSVVCRIVIEEEENLRKIKLYI